MPSLSGRPTLAAAVAARVGAAAVALFLLAGCGGGGGSSATQNSFTLKSTVVELDKTPAQVTSVTANSVVMTGAPALQADQIIIHNATDGKRFLRKVVSATTAGGVTTVTTADATVMDVFQTANIVQQSPLKAEDLLKLQPAQDGVTFTQVGGRSASLHKGRAPDPNSIQVNFSGMQLKDGNGNPVVQIDGSVVLGAGIETHFQKSLLSVDEFSVAPYANVDGELKARGRLAGSFTQEFPISLNAQIPVTPLGPLGINCDVQLMMKLEGSYSVDGQFVLTASVSAKEGVRYTSSGGWGLINEFNKTLNIQPPSARASIEMGVSLVRPKIGADVLGIGEVHITADVVKALARISGQTSPVPGFLVQAYADFAFSAGGSLKLGPFTLWNEQKDFDLGQFSIMQPILLRTYGPTDTRIAYADLPLRSLHVMNGDGSGDHVLISSTTSIYAPNLSNHGGQICYGKFNDQGRGEIWAANADGSNQHRITDGTLSINHPCWSPGADEIAFDASDANLVKQVYVVNVTTKAIRQLTNDTAPSRIPCWSADGTQIYYEHMGLAGKKMIAKTNSASPTYDVVLANDTIDYEEPSLSPNGLQLVCLKGGTFIVVSDEKGRGEHTILNDPHLTRPTWSPDGTRVIMQYNLPGTVTVMSFAADGTDQKNLATGMQPSWGLTQ